jgi:hypothetical protein
MFTYRGPADCALPDGTSMPVSVRLTSEPGLLDGITGTATASAFPVSYLNATEVTLRLPDGRARKFLIKDKNGFGPIVLHLTSHDDWLP